jgi:hypothetical protein
MSANSADLASGPPPTDRQVLRRRVQRHSPHRLLRKKVVLPGGIIISAEKHRGRVMVRVEVPASQR